MEHCNLRKQVLQTKGLTESDFKDTTEAFAAADAVIAQYQTAFPKKREYNPDIIFPQMPQLDQFWFADFKGIQ